ncbi:MAG: 50S ribosomal protein L29 [Candidatus Paceibacterota bacterium]
MKKVTYADKGIKDLRKLLTDKRKALRDFYFGLAGGKVTNVKSGRNLRKEIARIMTRLRELVEEGKV